ncbi:MAG: hypothetical protein ACKOC1_12450 [Hyphomicrobiales bacterium]
MNEEPKARSSINLDELERQLREASRSKRVYVSDTERHAGQQATDNDVTPSDPSEEKGFGRSDYLDAHVSGDVDDRNDQENFYDHFGTGSGSQSPPPFLAIPKEDRFPDVGDFSERNSQRRAWRSILLFSLLAVVIVAGGYAYLIVSEKLTVSGEVSAVPLIKADNNPVRIKPEVSSTEPSSSSGSELLSDPKAADGGTANVVSTKEQPVDLRAGNSVVPGTVMVDNVASGSSDRNASVAQVDASGPAADSRPVLESPPGAAAMPPVKTVRTVTVRADGSIIDPAGVLGTGSLPKAIQSPPTEPISDKTALQTGANQEADAGSTGPSSTTKQFPIVPAPLPPIRATEPGRDARSVDTLSEVSSLLARSSENAGAASASQSASAGQAQPIGGLYSVQFGAPGSNAEARLLADRVKARLGSAIASFEMGIFRGENSGKAVFRVRVVNVTRAEGQSLCDTYTTQGGQCFVTRN